MFDTLKYSRSLEAVGIPREQAEAHISMLSEIVEVELATKQDILRLEEKLIQLEYQLVIKLGAIVVTSISFATAVAAALSKIGH